MSSLSIERAVRPYQPASQRVLGPEPHTDSIIQGLVDGWAYPSVRAADHNNLGNFKRREIAKAELPEFALPMQLVDCLKSLLKGHTAVWRMEVEYVNVVRLQLLEGFVQVSPDGLGSMVSWWSWIQLRRKRQITLLVAGGCCEAFLGPVLVHAGCVDLVISGSLEVVKKRAKLAQGSGFGAPLDVLMMLVVIGEGPVVTRYRAKGHDSRGG